MPLQNPIPGGIIRYKGVFDFDGLYESVAEWFKRYRFQFFDYSYKHKVPSSFGAEQELEWTGEIKSTDFVKLRINVSVHIWDMNDVEVVKNGKKKLLTSGRIEIKINGIYTLDWQKKFEKSKFGLFLRDLWVKWLWRKEASTIWGDTLYYRMWDLHAHLKKFLDMQASAHIYKGYLGENR